MNIEIRRLGPDLAEEYVRFFDATPHSERPDNDECKCYCVWWCKDDHDVGNIDFLLSKEQRRDYAMRSVRNGNIQGYLAYCDEKVVGWCNANTKADCLRCYCWRRFMGSVPTEGPSSDIRVKSIFCFAIAPEMKRKGIARALLERVCQDAALEGFDVAEAYPNQGFIDDAEDFMGPIELFRKSGFALYHEAGPKCVMRKRLR